MRTSTEFKVVTAIGIIFAAITTFIAQASIFSPIKVAENIVLLKIFLNSFSIILLSGLVVNYGIIYRDLPTSSTRSLIIFSIALLFYAVSASPVVQILFGFNTITLGPFTYLPDLFLATASTVILYESYK